jgi:hypothetical protein
LASCHRRLDPGERPAGAAAREACVSASSWSPVSDRDQARERARLQLGSYQDQLGGDQEARGQADRGGKAPVVSLLN